MSASTVGSLKNQFRRIDGALVHESSYVEPSCKLGHGTVVRHFCLIRTGSIIGRDCRFGMGVQLGPQAKIGHRCRLQTHTTLFRGVILEDDVFCGPCCVFTNNPYPRAEIDRSTKPTKTLVQKGASIGANATIIAGIKLGRYCMIGAGAVVTTSVPAFALMAGVPARQIGWVSAAGETVPITVSESSCFTETFNSEGL